MTVLALCGVCRVYCGLIDWLINMFFNCSCTHSYKYVLGNCWDHAPFRWKKEISMPSRRWQSSCEEAGSRKMNRYLTREMVSVLWRKMKATKNVIVGDNIFDITFWLQGKSFHLPSYWAGVYSAKYINHQERATINYYQISKVPFVIPGNFLSFWGSSKEILVMMPLAINKIKFNLRMT